MFRSHWFKQHRFKLPLFVCLCKSWAFCVCYCWWKETLLTLKLTGCHSKKSHQWENLCLCRTKDSLKCSHYFLSMNCSHTLSNTKSQVSIPHESADMLLSITKLYIWFVKVSWAICGVLKDKPDFIFIFFSISHTAGKWIIFWSRDKAWQL